MDSTGKRFRLQIEMYNILESGTYADIFEIKYMGLKCIGKKLKDHLKESTSLNNHKLARFKDECFLHSQLSHPNIVQFLETHHPEGEQVPILIMEFLPTNLTFCVETYGILPKELGCSILHDIALGLCYLHSRTSPIIHSDLHSSNILLSSNMTAKISDLGMAKIQETSSSLTPGNRDFMPPETKMNNPKCNTSVDRFSYGVIMIHVFSGMWPAPQVGPIKKDGDILVVVSEAERRKKFIKKITDNRILKLIHNCISNIPEKRPPAYEIVNQLEEMVVQFPVSYAKRYEMLTYIEDLEKSNGERQVSNH